MTNKKSTKRALLMSLLAMLLCVTMLVGTTFAWFTDSVTSSGNIIKSGTLNVGMYWAEGQAEVPTDKWPNDAADGAIFNYANWEPGFVMARHLKIANEGSLALKYQVKIVATGTVSDLTDVIDVYYADPAVTADRTLAGLTRLGTLTEVLAGMDESATGVLLADTADTITIALKMQESAGNEYQDKSIGAEFAIQLIATQYTYEGDSFDDQYDVDAWTDVAEPPVVDAEGVVEVWTAEQLAGVMANTSGIKTINIMQNIDLSGRAWAPAYVSAPDLVINGNGYTISNMTTNGKDYQGFIGVAYQNITINDLTFKNAEVKANKSFTGGVIGWAWGNADVTFNNVDIVDSEISTTIANKAIRVGALIGFFPYDGGNLTLNGCDVTGTTVSGYHNVGAMVGTTLTQKTVTVENCTATNNTLKYGSPNVGAFDFGASTSGYTAYVPASGFTAENNKLVAIVGSTDALNDAIAAGKTEIELSDGEYTLSGTNDVVIVGNGADTVIDINGNIQNVNISNATVTGANSLNVKADNTAVFTNVIFDGKVGNVNQGVVNGDTTFVGCTFNGGIHIDNSASAVNVKFEDCTFGELGIMKLGGSASYSFEGCTIETIDMANTSGWGRQWVIVYSDVTFTDCQLGRVIRAGAAIEIVLDGCVDAEGNAVTTDIVHTYNSPSVVIR